MPGNALLKTDRQTKKIQLPLQISRKYGKKFTEDITLPKVKFQHFRLIYEICWVVMPALKGILVFSPHDCLIASSIFLEYCGVCSLDII